MSLCIGSGAASHDALSHSPCWMPWILGLLAKLCYHAAACHADNSLNTATSLQPHAAGPAFSVPPVVPPGFRLVSQGSTLTERCPRGEFKTGYTAASGGAATKCSKCPTGSSSVITAAVRKQDCRGGAAVDACNVHHADQPLSSKFRAKMLAKQPPGA
jgi:hypothetical protein